MWSAHPMPARRRRFVAGKLYELEIRTRQGLPFPCLLLIRLLLASAMARTQRDCKVTICHFLWMQNHLHLLFIAKDAAACAQFYSELMKKVTDYLKCLLGASSLELWEKGGAVVSEVLDLNAAIGRVAYLYANPSKADLETTVSKYPGFSSWKAFTSDPGAECHLEEVPWVRLPAVSALPSLRLDERQDKFITEKLKKSASLTHSLTLYPNAMYKVFGVTDKADIERLNESIMAEVAHRETHYEELRRAEGKRVKGANALRREPIMKAHEPKKKASDRKILFHTTVREFALAFLDELRVFCEQCRYAYEAWRAGEYLVEWPPGAFRPPLGPGANAIA